MRILILGPESRNQRIIEFLESLGNTVMSTEQVISPAFLKKKGIDFIVSSGYAPIIKEPVVTGYSRRLINLHISYLPYGKGIYPNLWSFLEDTPKGVTIHFIDEGIDTGAIICQREVLFTPDDTLATSHEKLMSQLQELFFEAWPSIANGIHSPVEQVTKTAGTRYHSRLESERIMALWKEGWRIPVQSVQEIGAEIRFSHQFWQRVDDEAAGQ